jgi:hypothetical protein
LQAALPSCGRWVEWNLEVGSAADVMGGLHAPSAVSRGWQGLTQAVVNAKQTRAPRGFRQLQKAAMRRDRKKIVSSPAPSSHNAIKVKRGNSRGAHRMGCKWQEGRAYGGTRAQGAANLNPKTAYLESAILGTPYCRNDRLIQTFLWYSVFPTGI